MENATVIPNIVQNVAKMSFSWYDYILFCLMLACSALIGIYFGCFGSKQATTDEYLMGNKKMKVFPISVSLVASHISGITLLAVPADVYRFGAAYWLLGVSCILVAVLTIYIFLPVFFKLQITSTYEYLEQRFDNKNRMFASFLFALGLFLYLPIVIYIPALAFSAATGINVHYITPVVCGICIFYTTLGGLKAVVWTDTLQFSITIGAVVTVFFLGVKSAGGFGNVWTKAMEGERLNVFDFDPDPTKRDSFWIVLLGTTFTWLANTGVHQSCVQKFLAVPTLHNARMSVVYLHLGMGVVASFSVFTGLIMYAKYATCDPFTTGAVQKNDQLLPYYIMDVASHIPGLTGLFVAGIFCAALSTLSASLNCLAGTMYEDFILKFYKPSTAERSSSHTLKVLVVIIGVICTAMVFVLEHLGGILPLAFSLGGVTAGPLLGMFTLGVLFPKVSSKGAFYGSIFALLFCGWISAMAQYYKAQGYIYYPPKPTSIEGCLVSNVTTTTVSADFNGTSFTFYDVVNMSVPAGSPLPVVDNTFEKLIANLTSNERTEKFKPFFLFKISYYYYCPLGTLLTIIVAILITYCLGNDDPPVHRDLISPIIYSLLEDEKVTLEKKKDYYSLDKALHLVTTDSDKEKLDLNY